MLSVTSNKHNYVGNKDSEDEDDDSDFGPSMGADDGGEAEFATTFEDYEEQGFLWMCTLCKGQPTFDTIYDLFRHKQEHPGGKSVEDTCDVKLELNGTNSTEDLLPYSPCDDFQDSASQDSDPLAPASPVSSEDIPLSNLSSKLNSLKNKSKPNKISKTKRKTHHKTRSKNKFGIVGTTSENQRPNDDIEDKIDEEISKIIDETELETSFDTHEVEGMIVNKTKSTDSKSKTSHVCKICNTDCGSRAVLSEHKKHHLFENSGCYKCDTCGKLCPKYDNFTRHLTIHKENREKRHECDQCYASFYNLADLKRHMVLHMAVKPFTCEHCGEGFTRHDNLLIHAYVHTGVQYKKFSCKHCDKVLNSPSALVMHIKTHSVKTVFCPEPDCKFSCYLQSQLKQHLRKHSGEKPFQCPKCGRCFARSNDMKNHILNVHDRFRPYKCPLCPKEFALVGNLKIHYATHTNERPYLCAQCGKCFNHPSTLRKHSVIMHNPWRPANKPRLRNIHSDMTRGTKSKARKEPGDYRVAKKKKTLMKKVEKQVEVADQRMQELEVKNIECKPDMTEYVLPDIQVPHVTVHVPGQGQVQVQPFVVSAVGLVVEGDLTRTTYMAPSQLL